MKNKKILLAMIALVLVAGVLAAAYYFTRPKTQAGGKTFTVTVVHSDGTEKEFTYTSDQEYLGAVLQAEGLVTGTGAKLFTVAGPVLAYGTAASVVYGIVLWVLEQF